MSLYIGGAQCMHAVFSDYNDWKVFDEQKNDMYKLAQQFNVSIDRYDINESDKAPSFVIMNKEARHECFYSGAAFDYNMNVEVSDTFKSRALEFIKALNETQEFNRFHHLSWSSPSVLYFVVS